MLQTKPTYTVALDTQGVWIDLPQQENENLFYATIYNRQGRRMAGRFIQAGAERNRHYWQLDHTGWPEGSYVLVVKGQRVLRQTKLIK